MARTPLGRMPKSKAEPWEYLAISGPCRVLSLSDVHIPYHDERALRSAVAYARDKFNPNVVLLNGDIIDFYSISRFDKDPSRRNLKGEIDLTIEGLRWLRGIFPRARFIFRAGNHEVRWDTYIWNKAAELWDLPQCRLAKVLELDKLKMEYVGDKRPILAGMLPVFHGHELAISSYVNPARTLYLKTGHTGLIGHLHRSSTHTEPDMWHSETTCWSQGCLCDLHPDYAPVNRFNHGFAVVEVDKDDEFKMHNFKIKDGKVRTV